MRTPREQWHEIQTVKYNLGAKNAERLIGFAYPGLEVKVQYPPKNVDCDVTAIDLPDKYEIAEQKLYEECGFRLYRDFADFMDSLVKFIPFESYEICNHYTNFHYKNEVYAATISEIRRYVIL